MITIEINGIEELQRKLSKLSDAMQGEALGRSLLAGAYIVEGYAKTLVPVDTGFLRSTIQSERMQGAAARVVATAEYAPYVEYGTSRMSAQPYMRPAADQHRDEIAQAVADNLRRELEGAV